MIGKHLWRGQDDERELSFTRVMLGLISFLLGGVGITNAVQVQGHIWLIVVLIVISVGGTLIGLVVVCDEFMNSGPDA